MNSYCPKSDIVTAACMKTKACTQHDQLRPTTYFSDGQAAFDI